MAHDNHIIHDNSFLDEVMDAQKTSVKNVQSGVKSFTENSADSVRVKDRHASALGG